MELINIVLGISHIGFGTILITPCLPLLQGSVKMNKLYGFRYRKSFESDENWYMINQYAAKKMILWCIVLIAVGIVTFFIPFNNDATMIVVISPLPLILLCRPS